MKTIKIASFYGDEGVGRCNHGLDKPFLGLERLLVGKKTWSSSRGPKFHPR